MVGKFFEKGSPVGSQSGVVAEGFPGMTSGFLGGSEA